MKHKLSILIATIMAILCITTSAFASSQYISDPNDQQAHTYNEQMAAKYSQMIKDLDTQFKKDNPTVNYYTLYRTDWNAKVFTTWSGSLLYTNYNGPGYYVNSGYTTISDGYKTHTVITLGPDPKPAVTKKYVATRAEYVSMRNQYEDAAQDLIIQNIDNRSNMLSPLMQYTDDKHVYLVFQIGNYTYTTGNGNRKIFSGDIEEGNRNAYPYIKDGNTMIPIRPLIEGLGGIVFWDNDTQTITAGLNEKTVKMHIGDDIAYVDNGILYNEPVKMTTAAEIKGGKTMIPLRFVIEYLGYGVDWIQNEQIILIKDSYEPYVSSYEYETTEYIDRGSYLSGDKYRLPFYLNGYYNGIWHRDDTVTPYDTHGLGNYYAMHFDPTVYVQIADEGDIATNYYDTLDMEYKYTTDTGIKVYEQMCVYRYNDITNECEIIDGDYNDIGSINLEEYTAERRMMFKAKGTDLVAMVTCKYVNAKYKTSDGEVYVYPDANEAIAEVINACFDKIERTITPVYKSHYE